MQLVYNDIKQRPISHSELNQKLRMTSVSNIPVEIFLGQHVLRYDMQTSKKRIAFVNCLTASYGTKTNDKSKLFLMTLFSYNSLL